MRAVNRGKGTNSELPSCYLGKWFVPGLLVSFLALPMAAAQESPEDYPSGETVTEASLGEAGPSGQEEGAAATPAQPAETAEQSSDAATSSDAAATPQDAAAQSSEADSPSAEAAPSEPDVHGSETASTSQNTSEATPAENPDVIPVQPVQQEQSTATSASSDAHQLEEIVVTAQKRLQFSQDVPISMSVVSEKFIKDQGITDVKEALRFVPNFRVVELAGRVSPQCRGFTVSDTNPAFEAPCGLALDGVSFSRGSYFSAGLLDLKRIEVLRGPQGTTFGKNTTAGVVSLVTKDPTDALVANVDVQHGLSGQGVSRAEVGVGGPLIPGVVNIRVAGLTEVRDPYMENTLHETKPEISGDVGNSERTAYRVKLTFPDVLGSELKLLHEKTELFSNGYAIKLIPLTDSWAGYIRQYDPNADFGENYKTSNLGNQVWTDTTRTQAELNFYLGDWTFTGVGAVGELHNNQYLGNALPAPIPLGKSHREEKSPFLTGELRAVSPEFEGLLGLDSLFGMDLGSSNLLLGVFGQQNDIKNLTTDVDAYVEGLAVIILAGLDLPAALPVGTLLELLREQANLSITDSYHIRFSQEVQTAAVFGQLSWNMGESWTLDLSGRFSEESKDGHWNVFYSTPSPLFNPLGDRDFIRDKSLDSSSFQPKASLTYKLSDDINLFAHWARAYKSGGFNAYTSTGDPEKPNRTNPNATTGTLTFDDESGTDIGFDVKMRLFDNRMQLNLSLFSLDVENFQVHTEVLGSKIPGTDNRLPNGYQQVVNAGHARAQGAELDLTWLAADWLTVIGAVGYNDTEYLSFTMDACGSGEEPDEETGKCDHTGYPFLGTPKLAGSLTLDMRFPMGGLWHVFGDTNFLLGGTAEYTGSRYEGSYIEAAGAKQDPNTLYRAHLGFANASQGWSFRLTALNLTDEYLASGGADPEAGTASVAPRPPRSIFAQLNWSY